MTSAPPVKKACDACHRRKVRCSGSVPCKNCGQANLQCTYLAIPQKKGPKGSRAKVISEIRDTQLQKPPIPKAAVSQNASSHKVPPALEPATYSHEKEANPFDFNSPPASPDVSIRNLQLLSIQTVESCISFFTNHLYPTMPIFSKQYLGGLKAEYRHGPAEMYCLVLALCSFILVQPGMSFEGMPMPASYEENPAAARYRLAHLLLKEIHQIRRLSAEYIENPTIYSAQTSFFMFGSYFGLEKANAGWYHLREAITLAHTLNMNEEATYKTGDAEENLRKRCFYWLVLLTERGYALHRHRPLSMLATLELPTVDPNAPDASIMFGFVYLASLFRLIDDEFMALWNKAKSDCPTSYLSNLQTQLVDTLPPSLQCTENQAADVKVTQHWLRCMVWQLSITNGYLSSNTADPAMSFLYPIQIARDLVKDVNTLSQQALEVHGVGLIEKLFDMSCTLSDVITYVPAEQENGEKESPQDYLNQLLNLISRLRGGASRYVPMLMAKVSENLHHLTNPLTNLPHTLDAFIQDSPHTNTSPMDIADPQSRTRVQLPRMQIPSPAQSATFSSRQIPYNEGVHTPKIQHAQDNLMFESYSPSVSSHTEPALTPPIYGTPGTPQSKFAPHAHHTQQIQPRSVPLQTPPLRQEGSWDNYHG